jgi:hypothetical protein
VKFGGRPLSADDHSRVQAALRSIEALTAKPIANTP